ncbi:MAG: hypothetical protein AAFO96_28030, partial [Bacteroidota bacterium]
RRTIVPPIPFERPEPKKFSKDQMLTMKLRSNPTDDQSMTYELSIPYFGGGTVEECLKFVRDVKRVIQGQNVTTGPERYVIVRRLLKGDALAAFNQAASQRGNETVANFNLCLKALVKHLLPRRAVQVQKRYMRRILRKPKGTSTREFVARVIELNEYIVEMDDSATKLEDDEIMDLLEFGLPARWQKTMVIQQFDPMAHSPTELVEFCERLEFAEPEMDEKETKSRSESKITHNGGKSQPRKTFHRSGGSQNKNKNEKWCHFHQTNGHDLSECKVMIAQAENMRGAGKPYFEPNKKKNYNNNNKKKRDAYEKNELHEMVKDAVASAVKTISHKKRKLEDKKLSNEFHNLEIQSISSDNETESDSE